MPEMTPEEAAEFDKKYPLNTTIIFGAKPPKWWLEKYGNAYECLSDNHDVLMKIFHEECEKRGVLHDVGEIFAYMQTFPQEDGGQLSLF